MSLRTYVHKETFRAAKPISLHETLRYDFDDTPNYEGEKKMNECEIHDGSRTITVWRIEFYLFSCSSFTSNRSGLNVRYLRNIRILTDRYGFLHVFPRSPRVIAVFEFLAKKHKRVTTRVSIAKKVLREERKKRSRERINMSQLGSNLLINSPISSTPFKSFSQFRPLPLELWKPKTTVCRP